DRIFIQWGYSYLYPAIASASHVTTMGQNYSLKFRIDVAMMGKLGFDMKFDRLGDEKLHFVKNAVSLYDEIKSTVWYGDLYRVVSPYEGNRAALMYVAKNKSEAVVFTYSLHDVLHSENPAIKLHGLDADKKYLVGEINLPEGKHS